LFGGLIIQGGIKLYSSTDGDNGSEGSFAIAFNQACKGLVCSYMYQQTYVVSANSASKDKFTVWARDTSGNRVTASVSFVAFGL
jgi:hypothetical protein